MAAEGQNKPISEIFLAFFVLTLILILLVEMPTWVINYCTFDDIPLCTKTT